MDGALVPGYLAGEDDDGYPSGIRDELSAAIGETYRLYSSGEMADDPEAKLEGYLDLIDLRKRAAVELLSSREWELAIVQVQKTDAVFHNFDDEAAFRAVYEAADDLAAAVLDTVDGPVNVVVCSDHGMGRKEGTRYSSTTSSATRGSSRPRRRRRASRSAPRSGKLMGEESESATDDGASSLVTKRRRHRRTGPLERRRHPGRVYGLAESLGVEDLPLDVVPTSVRRSAGEGVDWRNSRAYCRSASRLGVRINLAGREPSGTVPADEEYHAVREELIDLLSDLETPDGDPAFEEVVPREVRLRRAARRRRPRRRRPAEGRRPRALDEPLRPRVRPGRRPRPRPDWRLRRARAQLRARRRGRPPLADRRGAYRDGRARTAGSRSDDRNCA